MIVFPLVLAIKSCWLPVMVVITAALLICLGMSPVRDRLPTKKSFVLQDPRHSRSIRGDET